ncbi:hypothetical protein LMF32_00915 [Desemzia sp. C1]|uniref:hypothetical protein n=1 Tax=Desemzia sp. C1 TaxID=2892016 RepID=UPI001E41025C|nr:hypothetical protein [Desemzia sp. C1]MCI3027697.1 hypothetical protein [Desemzia sp. C1]
MNDGKANASKPKEVNQSIKARTHVFKKGDQLHEIATKNGMTVGNLLILNDQKREFKAGDEIKLTRDGD